MGAAREGAEVMVNLPYSVSYPFNDDHLRQFIPPPNVLAAVGDVDYLASGKHYAQMMLDKCGLNSTSHVLDVGCHSGRMAAPLTQILGSDGRLVGFDVVPTGVEYAQRAFSQHPSFSFQCFDFNNGMYNGGGTAEFILPYENDSFDIALAVSVFTHTIQEHTEKMLREITRLVRPGGYTLFTYFILDEESETAIARGAAERKFPYDWGNWRSDDNSVRCFANAYKRPWLEQEYKKNGLILVESIRGHWAARHEPQSHQDALIARKERGHAL